MPDDDPTPESDNTASDSTPVSLDARKRTKHLELVDQLLQTLDVLTFAQLSAAYLLDTLTFLLMIRTLVQIFICSPRINPGLPDLHPQRGHLSLIVGISLIAVLLHLFRDRPEAGEATRFYQHGGLLVDFVGQLTPISKWRLVFSDLTLLLLQVVMLTANIKRQNIKNPTPAGATAQDHNAEERGATVAGDYFAATENEEGDIEMHSLLAEPSEDPRKATHTLDRFYTGNVMVMELNLIQDIKRQFALEPAAMRPTPIDPERIRTMLRTLLGNRFRAQAAT